MITITDTLTETQHTANTPDDIPTILNNIFPDMTDEMREATNELTQDIKNNQPTTWAENYFQITIN